MKSQAHHHVKTKRLKQALGIPQFQAVGILESLWQLAIDCADEGNVGKFSDEEIAAYMEWPEESASVLIGALLSAGYLDKCGQYRLVVHDWLDHCPTYIKERIRKRQARKQRKQTTCAPLGPDKNGQGGTDGDDEGQPRDLPPLVPSIPNPTQPSLLKIDTPHRVQSQQGETPQEGSDFDHEKSTGPVEECAHTDSPPPRCPRTPAGDRLASKAGYRGDDRWPFERAAALVAAGHLTEAEVADAAEGCRQCEPTNPPAYFWALVQRATAKRIPDLNALARLVMVHTGEPPSEQAERALERDADLELEREWGPRFNALPQGDQGMIRADVLEEHPEWKKFQNKSMVKSLIRKACLELFRDRESSPTTEEC